LTISGIVKSNVSNRQTEQAGRRFPGSGVAEHAGPSLARKSSLTPSGGNRLAIRARNQHRGRSNTMQARRIRQLEMLAGPRFQTRYRNSICCISRFEAKKMRRSDASCIEERGGPEAIACEPSAEGIAKLAPAVMDLTEPSPRPTPGASTACLQKVSPKPCSPKPCRIWLNFPSGKIEGVKCSGCPLHLAVV
jgi:hypothetical protein